MDKISEVAQTVEIKQTIDLQKTTEKFDVITIANINNQFNMTVTNNGEIPIHLTRLWIENTTDNSWPISKYDLDITIPSRGYVTNVGQNLGLTALDSQSYIIKLVTERGKTQKIFLDSVSADSLYLSLSAIPTIVPTTFSTTLVLEVINTGTNKLINLQPEMDSVVTSCTATCSATIVSGPTPTNFDSLDPGDIAIFEWVYTIDGEDTGDSATFTASLVNGVDEDTAVVTVQPIINAINAGVSLSSGGIFDEASMTDDILLFHMGQGGVPSPGYQMMSSDVDGGTSGLLFNMETQTVGSAVAFMTNNGSNTITIPAGNWVASLALRSEAVATGIQDQDEDMIFHMEDGDGVNPDNSEGDSSRDLTESTVGGGGGWCDISSAICNANWDKRFEIVIDETKVEPDSGSHTDFTVLVRITGTDFTNNLDDADDSINDIRFTNVAGVLLDYEIEKYDKTSNELIAWVQIASLSTTTDHTFYMYFDNAETSGYGDEQDVEGTWEANFDGVYHLADDFLDSTDQDNDGTNVGSDDVAGFIGDGQEFISSNSDRILLNDPAEWHYGTGAFTVTAWVKTVGTPTGEIIVWNAGGDGAGGHRYEMELNEASSNKLGMIMDDNSDKYKEGGSITVNDNTWRYLAIQREGNSMRVFVNGVQDGSDLTGIGTGYAPVPNANAYIGANEDYASGTPQKFIDAIIDEVHIAGTARSADYLKTEYNNQNSPSTFYALTVQSTGGSGGPPDWQAGTGPHSSGAYYYDGVDASHQSSNYVSSGDENHLQALDLTTSLWFRTYPADTDAAISSEQMLFFWEGKGTYPNSDYYKLSLGSEGDGRLLFAFDTEWSLDDVTECLSTNEYDDGKWHHATAIRYGSGVDDCELYITDLDGTNPESMISGSCTDCGGSQILEQDGTDRWYVGSQQDAGNYFKGWIDDVMHWNGDALNTAEADDLARTNYGTGAHKLDVSIDRTDENGAFESNLYSNAATIISFYDNKAQSDTTDAAYTMFNVTMNMPQTIILPLQRLNFSLAFVPSTSTWEALELDMKIDDTGFTTPYPSYLQIPFPDNPFNSYIVYDNDNELNLFINNIGEDGIYFVYSGTRATFDDGSGVAYASLIRWINGTTPAYEVDIDKDSIYIPTGESARMYFFKQPTDHPCQGSGSSCQSANIIPAGNYRLAAWINGYSDQGETFGRSVVLGNIEVVE